jgi:general secretion pathway protein B
MSYILDALRKSDQQRRLGGVPTLATAAAMSVPSEIPTIVVRRLLGLLLIAVIATAIIWLRPSIMEMIMTGSVVAPAESPPALLPTQTAKPEVRIKVAVPVVVTADEPGKGLVKSVQNEMPRRKLQVEPSKPESMRNALPVMSITVHAYSSKPEDRLVSINGQLLKEGDTLAPGLILEQITPEGMIFDYRGKRIQRKAR